MSLTLLNKVRKLKKLKAERAKLLREHRQAQEGFNREGIPPEALPTIAELLPHWPEDYKARLLFSQEPWTNLGLFGGRGGSKSHSAAEFIVAAMVVCPNLSVVCIREIQRSLKYSAKRLIESKIRSLGHADKFDIFFNEIRRKEGDGICVFQGMQDHTAESVKSLEGFGLCWAEEAASLSKYSLGLLLPTIRVAHSRLVFTWNPHLESDAVDRLFRKEPGVKTISTQINWRDNPFITQELLDKKDASLLQDPEEYEHIWEGGYVKFSKEQVYGGKWEVREFTPKDSWDGPYHGADFGDTDPTCCVRMWLDEDERIYVEYESYKAGLDMDEIADKWASDIPGLEEYVIHADNSQPKTIRHIANKDLDKGKGRLNVVACTKWSGSILDGIKFIKSKGLVIHPRCEHAIEEMKLYKKKKNKGGDILETPVDKDNHLCDSMRYGLEGLIMAVGNLAYAGDDRADLADNPWGMSSDGGLELVDF